MAINVRLLRRVKARILAEPKQFVMDGWVTEYVDDQLFPDDDLPRKQIPNCGTAACIAGWTVALSDGVKPCDIDRNDDISTRARKLIGTETATRLFFTPCWPEKFADRWVGAKTFKGRARVAADRIEHFIKTKGKE